MDDSSAVDSPQTTTDGGFALILLCAALLAVSVARPLWADTSYLAVIGACLTVISSGALMRRGWRARSLTLTGVTGLITLIAFWAKWAAGTSPLREYYIVVPYDNDRAILIAGVFITIFAVTGQGVGRAQAPSDRMVTASLSPPVSLLFIVGLALSYGRYFAAQRWSIGVPGEIPRGLDVMGLKTVIYYACTLGPLACAALLTLVSRPNAIRWLAAIAVLVASATAGGLVGSRGAIVTSGLVLAFAIVRDRGIERRNFPLGHFLGGVAAIGAVGLGLTRVLDVRSVGSEGTGFNSSFGFLQGRIGGLDFLSVAAKGVDRYGASYGYVDTTAWVEFLTYSVYGYPRGAKTGVASTLAGTAYGIGTWTTLVVAAVGTGWLVATVDRRYERTLDHGQATLYLGMLLAWINLFLEGTIYPTLLTFLSFFVVYLIVRSGASSYATARPVTTQAALHKRTRNELHHATGRDRGGRVRRSRREHRRLVADRTRPTDKGPGATPTASISRRSNGWAGSTTSGLTSPSPT